MKDSRAIRVATKEAPHTQTAKRAFPDQSPRSESKAVERLRLRIHIYNPSSGLQGFAKDTMKARLSDRAVLAVTLVLSSILTAAPTIASEKPPPPTAGGVVDPDLPRFEISVSYVANLVHWIDNLAGSSRGKTIRTYRRYWQARHGAHTPEEMDQLRRWEAIRAKPQNLPQPEPRIENGCLPQVGDSPGWRQVFLLRSYEASSIGDFVDSLSGHLDDAERSDLRSILEAFEPRFATIWQSMSHMKEFEGEFRRYIDSSALRPFLGEVARFLGVRPGDFPPGRLQLMALPEESVTFASAIGRHLMMEIRPGDGPEEQVQVIAHETAHYLWQMMTPERIDALATQIHSASGNGPVIWTMMREGIPTAIGQGLADARLVPRRFGLQYPWYHIASIDRFAKESYPLLGEALTKRQTIDQGLLPRIALSGAGALAASAAPTDHLVEALHVVGQGMLPAYSQLIQQRPFARRWLFPVTDPEASTFLGRYRCLGGLILLGPAEAASPATVAEILRPVAELRRPNPPGHGAPATTDPPAGSLSSDGGIEPVPDGALALTVRPAGESASADGKGPLPPNARAEEGPEPSETGDGHEPGGGANAAPPLRSGVYATRRPGGGVLFHLVAAREEDIPRVADLFLRLHHVPDSPVWLDQIEP